MRMNSINRVVVFATLFVTASVAWPQNDRDFPPLGYKANVDFLQLPDGVNFQEVAGVALNSSGHLFAFYRGQHPLLEFDSEGRFVRYLAHGIVEKAHGLRVDRQNNIWITDVKLHLVVKLNPEGQVVLVLGQKGKAGEWQNKYNIPLFNQPTDIAFGASGNVFVSDGYGNSRIVKLDKDGGFITAWGRPGNAEGEFTYHTLLPSTQRAFMACLSLRSNYFSSQMASWAAFLSSICRVTFSVFWVARERLPDRWAYHTFWRLAETKPSTWLKS